MKKITFKEFLIEVDTGDLELAKQHQQKQAAQQEWKSNPFKDKMQQAASPEQGDIIQANGKNYMILKMSREGYHVKQAGGDHTAVIPHGAKFKAAGQGIGNKNTFLLVK